jgi:copper chaperone CopZ
MTLATLDHPAAARDYTVSGMTCGGCARKVNATLAAIDGVESATVTLSPPQAHLTFARPVSLSIVNAALKAAGNYAAAELAAPAVAVTRADTAVPADRVRPVITTSDTAAPADSLYPLFLIVGYIAGSGALAALAFGGAMKFSFFMTYFMAGFFLVFSFFKFLDLDGFASAYRSYDVVAKAWAPWGYIYPFVELALGVAYLLRVYPTAVNIVALVLMLVGSIGVLRALMDKRRIICACLGTALKLPMTTVTLVEDLGMAAMAAVMLVVAM